MLRLLLTLAALSACVFAADSRGPVVLSPDGLAARTAYESSGSSYRVLRVFVSASDPAADAFRITLRVTSPRYGAAFPSALVLRDRAADGLAEVSAGFAVRDTVAAVTVEAVRLETIGSVEVVPAAEPRGSFRPD